MLLASLALTGCEAEAPAPAPPARGVSPPVESPAPAPATGQGESALRYQDGRVWLDTSAADPRRLLWELSEQAGFLLDVTDLDATPLALRFDGAPLAEVVAALAGHSPFALDYERDVGLGRHVLVSVRVGRAVEVPVSTPRPAPVPTAQREPPARSPDHQRLIRALDIANLEARRELVEGLDAEGVELDVLSHVMQHDPEPEIRSLAADALVSSGTYGAVRNLIGMLDSDDPAVLVLAIESLEYAGDESVVPDLLRLLDHPDPAVRDAAEEAVDFLR